MEWRPALGGIFFLAVLFYMTTELVRRSRKGDRLCQLALVLFAASFVPVCSRVLQCLARRGDGTPLIECVDGFVLAPLCGFMVAVLLLVFSERPSKFESFWNDVCVVLGPGHEHGHHQPESGPRSYTLHGDHNGRSVEACVVPVFLGYVYSASYQVCLRSEVVGPVWMITSWPTWRKRKVWTITTPSKELEQRLADAGVIEAAERVFASQKRYVTGFRYEDDRLCCFCDNPEPPDVEQFRQYLDVLVWLDAINHQVGH